MLGPLSPGDDEAAERLADRTLLWYDLAEVLEVLDSRLACGGDPGACCGRAFFAR